VLTLERLEGRDCPGSHQMLYLWDAATGSYWGGGRPDPNFPVRGSLVTTQPPALVAQSHPVLPGDTARVQAAVMAIPHPLQSWFADAGGRVVVYSPNAKLTDLPEFAYLRGQQTSAGGDGNRTYDGAPAAAVGKVAYLPADLPGVVTHELGHVVENLIPAAAVIDWIDRVFPAIDWKVFPTGAAPLDYFKLNDSEAFAESFKLWLRHALDLEPPVLTYFDRLAADLGWLTS
jgi:hypothetical protein